MVMQAWLVRDSTEYMEMYSGKEIAGIKQSVTGKCTGEILGNLKRLRDKDLAMRVKRVEFLRWDIVLGHRSQHCYIRSLSILTIIRAFIFQNVYVCLSPM